MSRRELDRLVHGWTADGGEIVRYDRAGKWYIEYPPDSDKKRRRVTLDDAAKAAIAGKVVLGRYGGARFDARVRALQGGR